MVPITSDFVGYSRFWAYWLRVFLLVEAVKCALLFWIGVTLWRK